MTEVPARRQQNTGGEGEGGPEWRDAVREAQRCLGLLSCASCGICTVFCPDLCITRDEETEEMHIDLDYCKGCGICAFVCPKHAIRMTLEEDL